MDDSLRHESGRTRKTATNRMKITKNQRDGHAQSANNAGTSVGQRCANSPLAEAHFCAVDDQGERNASSFDARHLIPDLLGRFATRNVFIIAVVDRSRFLLVLIQAVRILGHDTNAFIDYARSTAHGVFDGERQPIVEHGAHSRSHLLLLLLFALIELPLHRNERQQRSAGNS